MGLVVRWALADLGFGSFGFWFFFVAVCLFLIDTRGGLQYGEE